MLQCIIRPNIFIIKGSRINPKKCSKGTDELQRPTKRGRDIYIYISHWTHSILLMEVKFTVTSIASCLRWGWHLAAI